jgi:hypothetical protein
MLSTRPGAASAGHPTYRRYISTTATPRLEPFAVADVGEEEEEKEAGLAVRGSTVVFLKPEPSMRKVPDLIAARVAFLCSAAPSRHCVELLYFDAFTSRPP